MLPARPILATYAQALTRSVLFSLDLDHALIDFLTNAAVAALTVLLAILFVAIRIPRGSAPHGDNHRSAHLANPSAPEL
jgi:hypothetical protein